MSRIHGRFASAICRKSDLFVAAQKRREDMGSFENLYAHKIPRHYVQSAKRCHYNPGTDERLGDFLEYAPSFS